MKKCIFYLGTCMLLFLLGKASIAQTVEQFKQQFYAQMQKLKPTGFTRRNVSFVQVIKGSPNGGYYPFKVTAYVHDYAPGYPTNHYYGQTCVGKFDGLKYDMLKDDFGGWIIQGKFTSSLDDTKCINNPSQDAEAIPLSSVQGTVYNPTQTKQTLPTAPQQKATANKNGDLYIGEYATYSYAKRITMMAGMGFTLLAGGKYYDQDKSRGGNYVYNAGNSTITFQSGFLDGQVGRKVTAKGFWITEHVFCEPWR